MSDLRTNCVKITLGEQEYGMAFDLNVIDDIQERFDVAIEDIGKLFEDPKSKIKNIKCLIALMINENFEIESELSGTVPAKVDERFVGRRLKSVQDATSVVSKVLECMNINLPKSDDESPNVASE